MINLASIAKQYQQQLLEEYGMKMRAVHRSALSSIINCDPLSGTIKDGLIRRC